MNRILGLLALAAIAFLAIGCQGELGERCDGFFQNTCRSPATCIELDDRAVCATGCNSWMGEYSCDDETWEMVDVTAQMGSASAAMGCFCVPPE